MVDRIKLINFKNFRNETISFNSERNIFVGENGVGKSSLLQAIALVLSGSYSWIESIGIDSMINNEAIFDFYRGEKIIEKLPKLQIELYLKNYEGTRPYELNGKYNSSEIIADGLSLIISPNIEEFFNEIKELIENENCVFPFEYYKVEFTTFCGKSYNSFNRVHKIKYSYLDTSAINYSITTKKYIEQIYENQVKVNKHIVAQSYREISDVFTDRMNTDFLENANKKYSLRLKQVTHKRFTSMLDAHRNNISINNFGMGEKVMLGVETLVISSSENITTILIEEPENHLSHLNVQKLIDIIEGSETKQIFIATHSNTIAAKLGLKNTILINENGRSTCLTDLKDETTRFFMKSPTNNILNLILTKKAILVEGDAEYILMSKFFEELQGSLPHSSDIAIISCGGKTFKRYLDVAGKLCKKIVVITDNDHDYNKNIKENYHDFLSLENIKIKADTNNLNYTFEICLYNENQEYYDKIFKTSSMSGGVESYLLKNKAEAAFRLLEEYPDKFIIPAYIKEAINWIID